MKKILLFVALLVAFYSVYAQDLGRLSLQETIDLAMNNSFELEKHQIKLEDAEAQIKERLSLGLPTVFGNVEYSYYIKLPTSILPAFFPETETVYAQNSEIGADPVPVQVTKFDDNGNPVFGPDSEIQFGLNHNITAGITAQSLLFDWSYLNGVKAAKTYKNYVAKQKSITIQNLKNQVRQAYLPALILDHNIQLIDSNIVTLKQLKFETEQNFYEGFVEELDVDRLRLAIANLEVNKENLLRQRNSSVQVLKKVVNVNENAKLGLSDSIEALLEEPDAQILTGKIDYSKRAELDVFDESLILSDNNIAYNKSGYYPSLSAFFSYSQQFQGNQLSNGNWFPLSIIGLKANVPIYSGGLRKALVTRAKLTKNEIQLQKEEFQRNIVTQIQVARANYLSAKERLENQKENLQLANKIYRVTTIKYKEGVGSSLENTSAEQSLYATQQNYIDALFDLLVAKYALDEAVGL